MKFTKMRETTFEEVQLNAGVLLKNFEPSSGTLTPSDIIGATSGGVSFSAKPETMDFGEDVDNCPPNSKELKKITSYEVMMSGNFVTVSPDVAKLLVGAADVLSDKITPRADLTDTDFTDLWWVGDYSDKNGETNGGFVAIHMMNSLSTGGFSIQSAKDGKGQFAFEFMGHYSIADQNKVPFEIYVKKGEPEA